MKIELHEIAIKELVKTMKINRKKAFMAMVAN
jgi:hypothetical protein